MKITAKDIAREAGVSEATVSIILNNKAGHYRISEKTRQKVLEIAERYQFTCNPIAVSMTSLIIRSSIISYGMASLHPFYILFTFIFSRQKTYLLYNSLQINH